MKKLLITIGVGALVMYLFDPRQGRGRRARIQQQIAGKLRRGAREASRKAEYARGQAEGLKHVGSSGSEPENDAVLTAKVESEVLRREHYPKGRINVNACDGIVELRGTCDTPEQISEIEQEVRKVTGVVDVHNYLHLPGTPAPNR